MSFLVWLFFTGVDTAAPGHNLPVVSQPQYLRFLEDSGSPLLPAGGYLTYLVSVCRQSRDLSFPLGNDFNTGTTILLNLKNDRALY